MAKWIKSNDYGDYSKTPDRSRTNSNVHIIREAKALHVNGKHTGSKSIYTLLSNIARAEAAIRSSKKEND